MRDTAAGVTHGPEANRAASDLPFEEFVAASSARLFTMAVLLSGQHRAEAEDLLAECWSGPTAGGHGSVEAGIPTDSFAAFHDRAGLPCHCTVNPP